MIRITNNFDFQPENEIGNAILTRKTLVANACINTVNKAMEVVGGQSFFRKIELERLFRDVQAGVFHPLPEKQQQAFAGSFLLNPAFPE
jgi:alkylation response protein AidB-like acyl-CoA dehydrogenase